MVPKIDCPIEKLIRVCELLHQADPDLGRLFADALHQHIFDDVSLDKALGLSGIHRPRYAYLRRLRDAHLAQALAGLGGELKRLETEIATYKTRVPSHVREAPLAPADWPDWRKALHAAARLGVGLPGSRTGLKKRPELSPPLPSSRPASEN